MQGSIAQILALAITGNAYLQGRSVDGFWPGGSSFQFCGSVQFIGAKRRWFVESMGIIAEDPVEWLATLKRNSAGLRAQVAARGDPRLSDHLSVGFVGGGSIWTLETVDAQGGSVFYESEWRVENRNAPDRRIWAVVYRQLKDNPPLRSPRTLTDAENDLESALENIAAFAERHDLGFVESFRRALKRLRDEQADDHGYHRDLGPPGFLSPQALRMIDACQLAWVFGGMGSWNDGAYGGDLTEEGDRVSDRLFVALQTALADAANSTFRGA